MSFELTELEQELQGMNERIGELDRMRQSLPELEELKELRQILAKQEAYHRSLGFFRRADKRRMEEQIREKRDQIAQKEVDLENKRRDIEDEIIDLNLARQAIETEMERRKSEA